MPNLWSRCSTKCSWTWPSAVKPIINCGIPIGEVMDVVLPGMEGLAVGGHQVFEVGVFGQLGDTRRYQCPGLHFMVMTVPQLLFVVIKALEALFADDVFDADEFGVGCVAIKDHALV